MVAECHDMKLRFIVGIFLLALPGLGQAFPFWLNGPTGRMNPNDPESPFYRVPTPHETFVFPTFGPSPSPLIFSPTPSNTVSPSQTPTMVFSPSASYTAT